MKDHTECVQLEYDPTVLSFDKIVGRILEGGGRNRSVGRQIMTGIWPHDDQQAEAVAAATEDKAEGFIHVAPFRAFYRAEDFWCRS